MNHRNNGYLETFGRQRAGKFENSSEETSTTEPTADESFEKTNGARYDGKFPREPQYFPCSWNPHRNRYSPSQMRYFPQHQNIHSSGYSNKQVGLCAEGSSAELGTGVPNTEGNEISLIHNFRSSTIEPPQLKFEDKVDNSNTPWVPRIREKPNALKPLELKLEETEYGLAYTHPYEYELEMFSPVDFHLSYIEPIIPYGLEETPLIFVDQPEQLEPLVNELLSRPAVAIDLEHHSFRSFQGFTCLMQISTHDVDYLIDTLALRSHLHILNHVFTNPHIVKVFHGARFDILWLQRDLSLYVVNMFDTYFAAKALRFSQLSLSFLLNFFCQIESNKGFQMADWRIRPLTEELKNYAREDTHYLLYIYAKLRNALLDAASGHPSLLESVYKSSTDICRRRYYKNILTEDSHLELCRRSRKKFNEKQLRILRRIYRWRDELARKEDESTGYVLPNHMLLRICEYQPKDMQSLVACCSPLPALTEKHLTDILNIVNNCCEDDQHSI